jgi:hypothetical protein
MWELFIKLAQIQAKEDFIKNAGFTQTALNIVKTPFKNMAEGYKEYGAARNVIKAEKAAIGESLVTNSHLANMPEDHIKGMASKVWKQGQKSVLDANSHLRAEEPEAYGKAVGHLSSSKLKDAKGKMLGGALQIGIPGAIAGKVIKDKISGE